MQYRPDIDGLRAIAVLSVIVHHAGIGILPGGFLGVDVFFVISGYLITNIIKEELEVGHFDFYNFYRRRVFRLLPTLLLVILVFFPIFWIAMLPHQMVDFARSVPSSILFFSNIFFWQESGYFERAAELKPLLHTWSLAVEEQFYIIFPLMLVFFMRFGKRFAITSLLVIIAISLSLCEYASHTSPSANFYLLPTRMWEILIGAVVALWFTAERVPKSGHFQALGLFLIGISLFFFDEELRLPSIFSLVPILGAVLVLIGVTDKKRTFGILTMSSLVWVGKISYSAYLWHQPMFVAYKLVGNKETVGIAAAIIIPAILIVSFLSWKFVEVFFRYRFQSAKIQPVLVLFIFSACISYVSLRVVQTDALEDRRLTLEQKQILYYETEFRDLVKYPCLLDLQENLGTEYPELCFGDGTSLLWGDSHATALGIGWRTYSDDIAIFAKSACPPILAPHEARCSRFSSSVLREIKEHKIREVSLHANWLLYGDDELKKLDQTIDELRKAGVLNINVIGGVPQFRPTLPQRLLEARVPLNERSYLTSHSIGHLKAKDNKIRKIAQDKAVKFVDLLGSFCDEEAKCLAVVELDMSTTKPFLDLSAGPVLSVGYAPLLYDYGHLSIGGSLYVARVLDEAINIVNEEDRRCAAPGTEVRCLR